MSRATKFKFRLFVAGDTLNSAQAISNLDALCVAFLPNRYEVEVIDVLNEPKRAIADGILMTPTLIKVSPTPVRKFVGTLSDAKPVLQALGLGLAVV
jgi:circadian clock protein KaiB